uniref:Uncharacterized protein n=1 Tax=Setaria italica TaxID=4555 RepID=K3ZFT5_SETIT
MASPPLTWPNHHHRHRSGKTPPVPLGSAGMEFFPTPNPNPNPNSAILHRRRPLRPPTAEDGGDRWRRRGARWRKCYFLLLICYFSHSFPFSVFLTFFDYQIGRVLVISLN